MRSAAGSRVACNTQPARAAEQGEKLGRGSAC